MIFWSPDRTKIGELTDVFYQGQPMKLWLPEPTPQQQLDTLNRSEHGGFRFSKKYVNAGFSATNRSCMYGVCIILYDCISVFVSIVRIVEFLEVFIFSQ